MQGIIGIVPRTKTLLHLEPLSFKLVKVEYILDEANKISLSVMCGDDKEKICYSMSRAIGDVSFLKTKNCELFVKL